MMFKAWRESQGQPEDSEPRKGKWNERSKDSTSQARPRYKKTDANKATRRLKQQVEKQKLMQQRKAFAKK